MDMIMPDPVACAEQHAYRTGHWVKVLVHEGAKVARCGDAGCTIGWVNMEGFVRIVLPDTPMFDQT